MALFDTPRTVILLPGTGSDAQFVEDAFGPAVEEVGSCLIAVRPTPADLVAGYREALDRAAAEATNPVVVGGVSIGAAVALEWATDHPSDVAGVVAALPAWTGDGSDAPAAASARATANLLRSIGLEDAIEAMTASSPAWLSSMLSRSWREQWPDLPAALDEAASYPAPTAPTLRSLSAPVGIAAALDDPIHPIDVARHWHDLIPTATLATFTLDRLGADPSLLGRVALRALMDVART